MIVGFTGQALFTARMLVQWYASERQKDSTVPISFWWLSIVGSVLLLSYAIYRRDPVIIVGQLTGTLVYSRNLVLIHQRLMRERETRSDVHVDSKSSNATRKAA
jgi:lipid-A-disaccharide synthase-like uncharacterized protein